MRAAKMAVIFLVGSASAVIPTEGYGAETIRMAGEQDTIKVREILTELRSQEGEDVGMRIARAAEALEGKGKDKDIYNDSTASLTLNMNGFTAMSFVNNALALGKVSMSPTGGWRSFGTELTNLACRQGNDKGFPSIMWHVSDWAGDNIYRGNLKELTENYDGARSMTISLDYLTTHRDDFAALKNKDNYENVRMWEMGFRSHKIPYLPRQAMGNKEVEEDMRNGDVIALVSDKNGTDRYCIGIVIMRADGPHLIYFDEQKGKVVEEAEPMKRYLNRIAKYIKGFRWFRVK